jgi:hypothetical protein
LFRIGSWRGVPLRVHWTMPVGALLFGGFSFVPAFWLAFFVLVLLHELGHAFVVQRFGHLATSVEVTGFGGLCRWTGHSTAFERAAIAWGGVLAQTALLILTWTLLWLVGTPSNPHLAEIAYAFTHTNLLLIGLNLLPFRPLDGAEAWSILRASALGGQLRQGFARLLSRSSTTVRGHSNRSASAPGVGFSRSSSPRARSRRSSAAPPSSMPPVEARRVADELIRVAEQAARARNRRGQS